MLKEKQINLSPKEYIQDLGQKLYTKITEVIQAEAEIEEVTKEILHILSRSASWRIHRFLNKERW